MNDRPGIALVTSETSGSSRAADAWTAARSASNSLPFLIAANLVPVLGVLFLGWDLATILVLYWIENGIVGIINVPKILMARGPMPAVPAGGELEKSMLGVSTAGAARVMLAPFFLVHYGMFWLVHGIFVFSLPFVWPGPAPLGGALPFPFGSAVRLFDLPPAIAIAAAGLGLSHLVSFRLNFLGRREYVAISPQEQMLQPYGRLVVLHVSIVFGSIAVGALGQPLGLLLVLMGAKTVLDVRFHLREHQRAQGRAWKPSPADWLGT